jgi:hypothetical protein
MFIDDNEEMRWDDSFSDCHDLDEMLDCEPDADMDPEDCFDDDDDDDMDAYSFDDDYGDDIDAFYSYLPRYNFTMRRFLGQHD